MNRPADKSNPPPPLRVLRTRAKCPVCGKPTDAKYQPFCAKRCADIDLGRWLKESYRMPTNEAPEDEQADSETGNRSTGQER